MKKGLKSLVGLMVVFMLGACSQAPVDKVAEAKGLVEAIAAQGAAEFAPDKFKSIKKGLKEAQDEISYQETLLFKNFAVASYTLDQVMDECDSLRNKMAESKGEPVLALVRRVKAIAD